MSQDNSFKIMPFISLYAVAHLVVDAACAYLLLGILDLNSNIFLAILTYNAIAFVLQAPIGLLIDRILHPKPAAMIGLTLVAFSFLCWNNIYAAVIIVSIGNALFHVGGGSLVLSMKNNKATYSGIYVAPGAIGLSIGTLLSVSRFSFTFWTFPILLMLLCCLVYSIRTPDFIRTHDETVKTSSNYGILLIILIMIPIAVRSLIGFSVDFPWKQNQYLLYVLLAAIVLGKVFGGILADKYGLLKVGVGGLLISTPLLAFYSSIPILGILGAFALNFTMPVTLIAILNILPRHKGLSFGLTTATLFVGALPSLLKNSMWMKNDVIIFSSMLAATLILFLALQFMIKSKISKA